MTVELLTEYHLEFLSLKEGCTGSSESTLAKIPHCWKSHVTLIILFRNMQREAAILSEWWRVKWEDVKIQKKSMSTGTKVGSTFSVT